MTAAQQAAQSPIVCVESRQVAASVGKSVNAELEDALRSEDSSEVGAAQAVTTSKTQARLATRSGESRPVTVQQSKRERMKSLLLGKYARDAAHPPVRKGDSVTIALGRNAGQRRARGAHT
jgi:hypothetical protein